MKKTFLLNLVILLVMNVLIKPFWIFGIDRTVQNRIGAQEYGMYFSLLGLAMVLNIILDAGITNFNNRAVARKSSRAGDYLASLASLKFVLAIGYTLIILFIGYILGYSSRQMYLLSIIAVNQFLQSMVMYLRSNVSGLQLYLTDSLLSVLDKALMILLCGLILWGPFSAGFCIEWFAYAQSAATLLTALTAAWILLYRGGSFAKINIRRWKSVLKASLPYATLVLLMASYNRIDGVMLERMVENGKHEAGLYAQGFRLLDAVQMIGYLFAGLLLPMFSRMISTKESISSLIRLSYTLILVGAFTLIIGVWQYKIPLTQLMYPGADDRSALILALLITSFGGIATTYIFGTLLTAQGNLTALNRMAAISLAINVILNFILIPFLGAVGSAIASLATQWFSAAVQVYLAVKKVDTGLKIKDALHWLLLPLAAFVAALASHFLNLNWLIGFVLIGFCTFAMAILTKQIRINEMLKLVRK